MFGKFTQRAQRVIVLAQEEARRLGHTVVGTEHLLLGLIAEGEGVASRALQSLGINIDKVRQEVEKVIGRGEEMFQGQIGFTPRAKRVLELAFDEAGHGYIGTEHLLLGLIREGEGVAALVLTNLSRTGSSQTSIDLRSCSVDKKELERQLRLLPWSSLEI